jgi:hypothetical protein
MSSASSTISAKSHSGTKFTVFPKLPPELRVKIWKYALPEGPRVIEVCCEGWPRNELRFKIGGEGSYPATSLLLVSVEAHTVAMKAYPLAFPTFHLKPVHFNFEKDTLYFRGASALKYLIKSALASPSDEQQTGWEMKKIRHVEYTGPFYEQYPVLSERGLGMFTGLRTLKIPRCYPLNFPQSCINEYQKRVEGDLERLWAKVRELEGIKAPMAGQECQVQWTTRDEWNLTLRI